MTMNRIESTSDNADIEIKQQDSFSLSLSPSLFLLQLLVDPLFVRNNYFWLEEDFYLFIF